MAGRGAGVDLGTSANGTQFSAEVTSEPWLLDVDALVISVGPDGLGTLGFAVQGALSAVDLMRLPLDGVTPDDPIVQGVAPSDAFVPRWLILVSARGPDGAGSSEAIARATRAALAAASARAVRRIGMPMIGAGIVGLDRAAVASTIVNAARDWAQTRQSQIDTVVCFDHEAGVTSDLAAAWAEADSSSAGGFKLYSFSARARRVFDRAQQFVNPTRPLSPALLWPVALADAFNDGRRDVAGLFLQNLSLHSGRRSEEILASLSATLGITSPAVSESSAAPSVDVPWLDAADTIATRTGSAIIRQRHLLAVAVQNQWWDASLSSGLQLPPDAIRSELRSAVAELKPDEFPDVWAQLLTAGGLGSSSSASPASPSESLPSPGAPVYDADNLAGGHSADVVDPDRRIPLTEDHLGLETYVKMLATLIARVDTPPPLSIGLFGEWGSGKSYFMGLLRQQIDELSRTDSQGTYYGTIEQITFNAWHYSDTNLWASLADELFEQLAGAGEGVDAKRTRLRRELSEKLEHEGILNAAVAQTRREVKTLKSDLERARTDRESSAKNVVRAIAGAPTLKAELDKAWRRLGIADDAEQAALIAAEFQGVETDVAAIRKTGARRLGIAVLAVLAVGLIALGGSAFASSGFRNSVLGAGIGAVSAALAAGVALLRWARSGLDILRKVLDEARQRARESAQSALAQSITELESAQANEGRLTSELETVTREADELGNQLKLLAPGQRLYSFVHDRVSSGDYGRRLGLISLIRRDFEKLVDIMHDWREHPELHGDDKAVDRIVLYIDDLDRCTPRQVVDVLQAVHLLLALELFVVVVGVDPRWLRQSLLAEYPRTLVAENQSRPSSLSDWMGTPNDYLEKIFNIPFVLPGMTKDNFRDLIRGWGIENQSAGGRAASNGDGVQAPPTDVEAPAERTASAEQPGDEETPVSSLVHQASITTQAGSDLDMQQRADGTDAPKPTPMRKDELDMLALLGRLVQTPRDAKRLFNLYRMLRSTRNLSSANDFLGHNEFQAVALLLGLLTAEPELYGQLLFTPPDPLRKSPGGLMFRKDAASWKAAWTGLDPREGIGSETVNDLGPLDERTADAWRSVQTRAAEAVKAMELKDISAFRKWGPSIARFSFVLSPLAAVAAEPTLQPSGRTR